MPTLAAHLVVPCPRGAEALLSAELTTLGMSAPETGFGEVHGDAGYETALRICLWSRVASRVLWPVADFVAEDPEALYAAVRAVSIEEHLAPGRTFAIDLTLGAGTGTAFPHSQYAMLKVKDAIVDRLREVHGERPNVDREHPDLRWHVHVAQGHAWLSIDLAGEALHRRGYRSDGRAAPLKENLAAALLLALGWPARAKAGQPFCDPMCGSGTILIEAAMIVGDRAPGLLRQRWGFSGWSQHDESVWVPLADDARARARAGLRVLDAQPPLLGFDADAEAIAAATRNAEIAGLGQRLRVATASLAQLAPPEAAGLLVTNPPYGERLGDEDALPVLYRELGDVLRRRFPGWTVGVLTAHGPLPGAIGLRPTKKTILWNGPIECRLLEIPISAEKVRSDEGPTWRKVSAASEAFSNRLVKNLRHLGKWARREGVTCLRAYDADLPEYAVAVDVYEARPERDPTAAPQRWAHVQEYAPPSTVDPGKAARRLADVLARVPEVLQIPAERVVHKLRRRQRPGDQHEASGGDSERLIVEEGGHRFLVNLRDYLDTGLFLDQRALRRLIQEHAVGRDFLNLYAYTGSATVYAAAGARSSTSVDLSRTYLAWAEDNFSLNGLDPRKHRVVQDDCQRWLELAAAGRDRWGTIFLAPPTFSNSKRMEGTLDLQRDHAALLSACARLLDEHGAIFFVNHFRRFKMEVPPGLVAEEITHKTLPPDFSRDSRFHGAWRLRRG